MKKENSNIEVFCGKGKGKTALAIGEAIKVSAKGQSVIIIQFLKGSERSEVAFLEDLGGLDIKLFRFEKMEYEYNQLSDQEKAEERTNILNGMNFARKVIVTQECDFLVLDEILGLISMGIVTREMVEELLSQIGPSMHVVLTGRDFPEWLSKCVDCVTTLSTAYTNR